MEIKRKGGREGSAGSSGSGRRFRPQQKGFRVGLAERGRTSQSGTGVSTCSKSKDRTCLVSRALRSLQPVEKKVVRFPA